MFHDIASQTTRENEEEEKRREKISADKKVNEMQRVTGHSERAASQEVRGSGQPRGLAFFWMEKMSSINQLFLSKLFPVCDVYFLYLRQPVSVCFLEKGTEHRKGEIGGSGK